MRLLTLGLNHSTAPLPLRERVAVPSDQIAATLHALTGRFAPVLSHAVVLSTCNRTEIYAATGLEPLQLAALKDELARWIAARHDVAPDVLLPHWYWHVESVRHACRVASGLDSMVLGEPQILGQMKQAVREADLVGTLGTPLRQVFDRSFAVAKTVRTTTAIGSASVSMAAAAVRLSERIFERLSDQHIVLIGAGEMIELVARHFAAKKPASMAVANRTLDRGEQLAARLAETGVASRAMLLSELPIELARFDIVIASTASTLPLVGLGMVERALKARRHRPMFMVDLGVPRDIEPEVGRLDDVFLYTVDDLGKVVSTGMQKRREAVDASEAIIDREVAQFMHWLEGRETVPAIRDLHRTGARAPPPCERRRSCAGDRGARARHHQQVPARTDAATARSARRRARASARISPAPFRRRQEVLKAMG